jgi:hypothetical protein
MPSWIVAGCPTTAEAAPLGTEYPTAGSSPELNEGGAADGDAAQEGSGVSESVKVRVPPDWSTDAGSQGRSQPPALERSACEDDAAPQTDGCGDGRAAPETVRA